MAILMKILVFIVGMTGGIAMVKYSFQLTHLFGHNDLAERYLGSGGSYSMWKLLGLIIIFGTIWYVFS